METDLLKEIRRGPLGGNLDAHNAEWRNASHTAPRTADGLLGLHNLEYHEVAANGKAKEQPWHRMAAYMIANGCSNTQVARAAGKAESTVCEVKAQRWFQELLAHITTELGDDISRGFKSEAQASLAKLVELRENAESESVQLSAARTIIEQAIGKPVQKVFSVQENTSRYNSMQAEAKDLREQLAAIRRARGEKPVIDIPSEQSPAPSSSVTEATPPASSEAYPSDKKPDAQASS